MALAGTRKLLQSKKYDMSADPDNKGCYLYRAAAGDTIDQMAKDLGVSAETLRETNSKNIADFTRINGRFIQICNIGSKYLQDASYRNCIPHVLC
jgi:hypothetical protein